VADVDLDKYDAKVRRFVVVNEIREVYPQHSTTMNADREAMGGDLEKPQAKSQIQQRLDADVDARWADLILLGCFFCSGLIDSMAFNMYACFVSMQTGQYIAKPDMIDQD
jgi:hypothetical protein